jgi:hypothetical protein
MTGGPPTEVMSICGARPTEVMSICGRTADRGDLFGCRRSAERNDVWGLPARDGVGCVPICPRGAGE